MSQSEPPTRKREGRAFVIVGAGVLLAIAIALLAIEISGGARVQPDPGLNPPGMVGIDLTADTDGPRGQIIVTYANGVGGDHEPLTGVNTFGTGVPIGGTVSITVIAETTGGKKPADQVTKCDITPHPAYLNDDDYEGEWPEPYVTKSQHGKGTITCTWTNVSGDEPQR